MTTRASATSPAGTVAALRGLRKTYGEMVAVDDFSLEVEKGEVVCLLGPSGCGKTTTLRMIAGFVEPTAGHVEIEGKEVTRLPPYRRDTGMVFQAYALFPHMTVAENVAFGLVNIGVKAPERNLRVTEMLEMVELQHLAARYPKELSGGQQQRVALARALALKPAVLLLDEPFSNLDAQLRMRLRQELRALIDRINITTLFVTHDQEEALALADRIVVMNAGRVEQVGTPEQIYEYPESRFVAEFIGWCSLLEGVARQGTFVSHQGLALPVESSCEGAGWLMLRPEHIKLAVAGSGRPRFKASVESTRYSGAMTRITARILAHTVLMDVQLPGAARPAAGQELEVEIDPAGLRLIRTED